MRTHPIKLVEPKAPLPVLRILTPSKFYITKPIMLLLYFTSMATMLGIANCYSFPYQPINKLR